MAAVTTANNVDGSIGPTLITDDEKLSANPSSAPESPSSPSRSSIEKPAEKPDEKSIAQGGVDDDDEYPPTKTVLVVMAGLFMAIFLVALDRLIIAIAIPVITNHFNSLNDVGWYASAFLLTSCAFQPLMGRVYTFFNPKWVFLSCIGVFELGSLICAVAPNSITLIVGRAVAGLGSAGIFSGAITLIVHLVPLHKRPAYTGAFGAVFAVASVAGPLLGGVFTDYVSWRWCFYINLPIGAVTVVIIMLILKLPEQAHAKLTYREKLMRLDPYGTAIFVPSVVCLLLALEWGGTKYAWNSGRIIALLVVFGLSIVSFIAVQIWKKEMATVPPRILMNRSMAAGSFYAFCLGSSMMTEVFFLPIWFQAVKGSSAVHAGIMTLPLILGLTLASIAAGVLTRKIGYYVPWMYVSTVLTSIGAGLITTFTVDTNHSKWIGYQIVYGLGLGFGMQQPNVAAQTVLPKKDVPTGAALIFFFQLLGGAIFSSVSNNIFDNKLTQGVEQHVHGLNPQFVTSVGATDLRKVVPPNLLPQVLDAYNSALRNAFYVGVALACMTIFGALTIEWKSIKRPQTPKPATPNPTQPSTEKIPRQEETQVHQESQPIISEQKV